ncbi:Cytochrome-c oxidase [Alteripontixanthobacter maritimus]|uniref:Cytochrome-c oxidase n=1 Tax=Alteripontixanthobacter maritimus TaxID=2161824 RepID=A0A369QBN6_9SPHN|nr:OmpA family protein [Alteripontixanthobacter maritimus]RDC60646.1 Cytochrome-c oxidase [Alteripontixanthobacter maritimus]
MRAISRKTAPFLTLAILVLPISGTVSAQQAMPEDRNMVTTVTSAVPADLSGYEDGPKIEGIIAARGANTMRVAGEDGAVVTVYLSNATKVRRKGGFLGLERTTLDSGALLNGLPVTVETVQWDGGLVASNVRFNNGDYETASMIRNGTSQQFAEQGAAIDENTALAEALRGRMADIDKYNIKGVTNVYFDTGKWNLGPADEAALCNAAREANATENALLLVVGYTDSVGSQDYNQVLSEKRAGRVVNYLQQACKWEPWRMLTPTGMAEADPAASNDTPEGKAQNRRVSVNVLVSKSVDGV